ALLIAFGWNYMPLVAGARALLVERRIGQIEFLTLEIRVATRELLSHGVAYNSASGDVPPQSETFIVPEVSGGGQAPVTLSHAFGMALYLTRLEPVQIYAQMFDGPAGVDLHDATVLNFDGGAVGTVNGASSHESKAKVE